MGFSSVPPRIKRQAAGESPPVPRVTCRSRSAADRKTLRTQNADVRGTRLRRPAPDRKEDKREILLCGANGSRTDDPGIPCTGSTPAKPKSGLVSLPYVSGPAARQVGAPLLIA